MMAPVGSLALIDPAAAVSVAGACKTFGSLLIYSTFADPPLDVVRAKVDHPLILGLYVRGDQDWLDQALAANKARVPDVLAIAMQYIRGATAIHEDGLQIAGDARYGPGTEKNRQEGSDFNDYLGVTWTYPGEPADRPEPKQFQCLDCSGYMRMVWGFRHHLPEEIQPQGAVSGRLVCHGQAIGEPLPGMMGLKGPRSQVENPVRYVYMVGGSIELLYVCLHL